MTRESSLIAAAERARSEAYAPYSGFAVGAALLGRDGAVHTGANVENASYGLSMCAERVALFAAVAQGARDFELLAVVGPDAAPLTPCGACRQALHEFGDGLRVVLAESNGPRAVGLDELLPAAFGPARLAAARASETFGS